MFGSKFDGSDVIRGIDSFRFRFLRMMKSGFNDDDDDGIDLNDIEKFLPGLPVSLPFFPSEFVFYITNVFNVRSCI